MLWAYRGLIKKSIKFSPYKLLLGRKMRMPLDELVEQWNGRGNEKNLNVIKYLRLLKEKIAVVQEIAKTNEAETKSTYREYHDWKAIDKNFEEGDYVLIFQP